LRGLYSILELTTTQVLVKLKDVASLSSPNREASDPPPPPPQHIGIDVACFGFLRALILLSLCKTVYTAVLKNYKYVASKGGNRRRKKNCF
jgi:hypothetical protein